jgi:NAD(P)-dependent dehydrogenase (short-subunit alcohol dehydrogenase family)
MPGNLSRNPKDLSLFRLDNRVVVITGGAGLLGEMHAEAVAEAGAIPVLVDIRGQLAAEKAKAISERYGNPALGLQVDITNKGALRLMLAEVLGCYGRVDVLINNAANDPKVAAEDDGLWTRFEHFPETQWHQDLAVGLTGAFLTSQVIGEQMVKQGGGVIINISSDLGMIAPDQRLYRKEGATEDTQPVKPVSYSVVKHALIGLTRYLATYWAEQQIRVNALAPGGIQTDQPEEFVRRVSSLIPLSRMARRDEYKGAILFLASDASSYMTGTTLVMDGGRSCW